jgi:hypothetical protein
MLGESRAAISPSQPPTAAASSMEKIIGAAMEQFGKIRVACDGDNARARLFQRSDIHIQ